MTPAGESCHQSTSDHDGMQQSDSEVPVSNSICITNPRRWHDEPKINDWQQQNIISHIIIQGRWKKGRSRDSIDVSILREREDYDTIASLVENTTVLEILTGNLRNIFIVLTCTLLPRKIHFLAIACSLFPTFSRSLWSTLNLYGKYFKDMHSHS